jgi:Fe-S cluster assembly iron-binding protein IscA
LGLALDERQDTDKTFEQGGITFMIDEDLLERIGNVQIDFIDAGMRSGFSLTPGKPLPTDPNTCGSDCC